MRPSVWDEAAWRIPAGAAEVAEAASFLLAACESGTTAERTSTITRLLSTYRYTRAELYHAMTEVPRYPKASHRFGRGLNLADVEDVIAEHRRLRAAAQRGVVSESEMRRLLEADPSVSAEDFGAGGTGEQGTRYVLKREARERLMPERRKALPAPRSATIHRLPPRNDF